MKCSIAQALSVLLVAASAVIAPKLCAQKSIYADYPQKKGKLQELQWDALPSWATIDFELRGRTEGQTAYNLTSGNGRVYELTRVHGGIEVRPTKHISSYLQFHDNHALGLPTHIIASNMRDAFDLRQAYVEFRYKPADLYFGRQELKFGSERLIGVSDWTNNSRTFDGIDLRLGDKNKIDLFSTSVVNIHPTALDTHGAGLNYHGAYGSIAGWIPNVELQPFVFIKAIRNVTSQQNIKGSELIATFGAEVEGKLPAHFDYLVNGALQRGSYSNDSVHAGEFIGKLAYTAEDLPGKPRLGGEFNWASGNTKRDPTRINTFDQQYPSNHNAFGLVDEFGYQNIRQERINLDIGPRKDLYLLFQGGFLNLVSRNDALYTSGGSVLIKAPPTGFNFTDIGSEFDISGKYVFHDYIVVNAGVGHFFPGAVMTHYGKPAPLTVGYFSLTYRFRVDKHAHNSNTQP
jgi:hypothetical protein